MSLQRILFSESSPNLGGQELQLLQQMTALRAQRIDARLICRPDSRIHQVAEERGLPALPVPMRNSLHPPSIAAIVGLLRRWRPEAIISHSGHDANNCAAAAFIVHCTGQRRPRLLRSRTYQPGRPSAWSYNHLADLTFTPSEALRRELLANPRIDPQRIQVLYPGIDLDHLRRVADEPLPADIVAWRAAHPGPLLVQAAMLRPEKGHATLLAALAQLVGEFPTLRYIAAGEGELRTALEAQAQALGLGEHVFFAGLVPQVAALYRCADQLVMPSLIEPLGMSQSEALALSVPVVASRTGGIPETMEHGVTGLLAPPGDVAAWVAALRQALTQPDDMRRMAERGRSFVETHFSLAANTGRLIRLIESTLP
jgi:glycosyltransferase involved in cell wall biosynthesis